MLRARQTLEDCIFALDKLTQAQSPQEYRVMFLATLALCRAVNDVLMKVDAIQLPRAKKIIEEQRRRNSQYKKDKSHIFWGFILAERNNIIHEYKCNVDDGPVDIRQVADIYSIVDFRSCAMKSGPFYGVDSQELLRRAIEWLDAQLIEIEKRLAKEASSEAGR